MKKRVMAVALASALSLPGLAMSAPLTVCPDGTAGSCVAGLTGLDWSPSNIVADGGNLAVANRVLNQIDGGTRSTAFTVLAHGTLAQFGGIAPPAGLNTASGYTWTYVLGFGETVTNVSVPSPGGDPGSATANFRFDTTNTTNFWEVYYKPTTGIDVYAGTGFNDGIKVFAGTFTGFRDYAGTITSTGQFSVDSTGGITGVTAIGLFDQAGVDDWGGQRTVIGTGSNSDLVIDTLTATIAYVNNDFIKGVIDQYQLQNVGQTLPFAANLPAALGGELDPSLRFVTAAGAPGNVVGPASVLFGVAAIGTVNGESLLAANTRGGNDIQFQADFNSNISGYAVPEPGSLALLGLGLAVLGARAMRRKG